MRCGTSPSVKHTQKVQIWNDNLQRVQIWNDNLQRVVAGGTLSCNSLFLQLLHSAELV